MPAGSNEHAGMIFAYLKRVGFFSLKLNGRIALPF